MCALIGLIMLVAGIGAFIGLEMLVLIPLGFVFIIVPVSLFGCERYMYVGRRAQRMINIIITVFIITVATFAAVMMVTGAKPPVI